MHRRIHGLHAGLIPGKGRPIQSYLSAVIPCNSPGNVLFTMTIAPLLGLTWTENSFFSLKRGVWLVRMIVISTCSPVSTMAKGK